MTGTKLSFSQFREGLSDALSRVQYGRERIVIQRHSKNAAVLISIEDLKLLQRLEDRADEAWAEKMVRERSAEETEETVSLDELRKDLDL